MKKLYNNQKANDDKTETGKESMFRAGKSFYEYLRDMRLSKDNEDCDYCTAFMFV